MEDQHAPECGRAAHRWIPAWPGVAWVGGRRPQRRAVGAGCRDTAAVSPEETPGVRSSQGPAPYAYIRGGAVAISS